MLLIDVNVLVYAHRSDAADHVRYRGWLEEVVDGPSSYGMADLVLSGFVRVVTHPRVFLVPDAYLAALAIESGSEWITTDGDYARFPGLRWRRPLAERDPAS